MSTAKPPQVRLAEAVLAQAFEDVNLLQGARARWGPGHVMNYHDRDIVRRGEDALAFLTATDGPLYKCRRLWCQAAGQSTSGIRRQAREKYEETT